jgi:nucleoside-diphosphate-sugar epimerase
MRILVIGAHGTIGREIVNALFADRIVAGM